MNSKPSWLGYVLNGRYQIETPLGQGGMSAVYRATDPNLRRTVAIKLIHSHLASDPEFVRRFEEEAAAVARLRHPNIIQVFDFNHDGDTYYMVLEFLPGTTLLEMLEQANQQGTLLSPDQTLNIMIPLCEAVAYAHRQGMIHRDLKPANVMINPQGQPVLMDFGIAKIVGGESMTATGGVIGTVAYLSPEQIRGERPDHRADIYALGIILYQMLSGRLPFQGENTAATMMQHLTTPVPDVRQFNRQTPPELVTVVQKALAKDANQRYQSAEELMLALRQVSQVGVGTQPMPISQLATTPVQVSTPTTGGPRPQTSSTPSPPPPTGPAPQGKKRPGWVIPAAAGVGVLGLLLCLIVAAIASQQILGGGTNDPTLTPTTLLIAAVESPTETSPSAGEQVAGEAAAASPTTTPTHTATATPLPPSPTATVPPPTLAPTLGSTPTDTPPTVTPTPRPTAVPSPTAPTGPRAEITSITVADDRYSVSFQVFGFFSDTSSTHVHFFWNTVPPDQAGVPGNPSNWKLYGSPSPFTGYAVSERPEGATQLCILVANPNHSVIAGSGNCRALP
ncbi:MAG: serine/threonine protein kinase [Anaerolineae bacterium]|nr:serine/threonine protein kinase [Anaerolineae bacterium]